ncbi:MAG: MiaB/RimO family radical SAM methylthiotransferase [Spirochaetales bacterium]|nr:MiaB/RimO family radical SAM methylthiotransferase [Spirochaetales bacterium]
MKYFLVPFGCQMNLSDSERVRRVIESMGYSEAEKEEDAQLLGIIACSVRQKAIDRVYSRIHAWNLRKRKEPVLTFVSGCILEKDREKFLKLFDLVFTMGRLEELPEMIRTYGVTTPCSQNAASDRLLTEDSDTVPSKMSREENLLASEKLWHIQPRYISDFDAYVPIQNGCDKFCTYCAVPYTRGREVSRPSGEILAEVEDLMKKGYSSITLLGQNVNSYGKNARHLAGESEMSFAGLLERIGAMGTEISAVTGRPLWVYFTSPHPRDMSDDVIDIVAACPVLAKQIHLPLQSGSDEVLSRMNRNHRVDDYLRIVEKIRNTIPSATLFTDIIVGFTGETDEEFASTRRVMEDIGYDMAFIAQYSPRPGAVSAKWDDDVPHQVKKERFEILSGVLKETASRRNAARVGTETPVLITGMDRKPGFHTARTEGRINIRIPGTDPHLIGRILPAQIEKSNGLTLFGSLSVPSGNTPESPSHEGTQP